MEIRNGQSNAHYDNYLLYTIIKQIHFITILKKIQYSIK